MIRAEDLSIEIRDNDLVRHGQIDLDDVQKLEMIKRFCNVGTWDMILPAEADNVEKLKQHRGITVTGRYLRKTLVSPETASPFSPAVFDYIPEDIVLMSGRVDKILTEQDSDDLDGMIQFIGFDDNIHLADALAWPQPSNPDPNTQSASHHVLTGNAESVIRQYVAFNIGDGASALPGPVSWGTPQRLIPGLILEHSSQNRGANVTARARFDQLGKLIGQVALEGGLGFDLAQDLTHDKMVLRIYVPADKSDLINMSIDNDDLRNSKYGISAPRATRAIIAGQGEGTDRVIIQRTTAEATAAEAEWGRKIEVFKDRRDTDQLAELEAEGDVIVTENGITITSLSVVPAEDMPNVYGRDWFLGDIVGVEVAGQQLSAKVTEAILKLDSDGLRIGATLGDPQGFDFESALISKQKDQETRLAHLEKNAELGDYASASHTHAISGVTDLQTALDGKAASSHTHAISGVTDLQTALDGKAASSHTHAQNQITFNISTKSGTALPSTYPLGVSIMSVGSGDAGWPTTYGTVVTYRSGSTRTTQTITAKTTGRTWTRSEDNDTWSAWRPDAGLLPDGQTVVGASTQSITATAWADIPNLAAISITAEYPAWVDATLNCWANSAADLRIGINVTGATTVATNAPAWGNVVYGTGYRQVTSSKRIKINAGTTTFTARAYRTGSGSDQVNYSEMTVLPLRWAP